VGFFYACQSEGKTVQKMPTCVPPAPVIARVSLHYKARYRICAHGTCFRLRWEGTAVTSDAEISKHITAIVHDLLSSHCLAEAFFAALPHDLGLRDAEWEAIEHAVLVAQQAVHVKAGHLLEAFNALRGEWADRQWEGVVLGLLMASRLDLLSDHPSLEHAWVRLQVQQLLQRPSPGQHTEPEEA
jgi:hypothetical protein